MTNYKVTAQHGKQYICNADLPFVKEGQLGNLYVDGEFTNSAVKERIPFSRLLKWQLTPNPQRAQKRWDNYKPAVSCNEELFTTTNDCIVWLGHAAFFIRLNGINLLFDPCLKDLPLMRRRHQPACQLNNIRNLDYILFSHAHRDHYDSGSVQHILKNNPNAEFLLPLKMGHLVAADGGKKMQEAAWYQRYNTSRIDITFTPAKHWNRRGLLDFNRELWGGFVLSSGHKRIFYCGDSGYGQHFKEINAVFGHMDTAILPIGAYKPRFMMKDAHMGPEDAVQAFHDLGAKRLIPMHHGTYDLSDEPPGDPIRTLQSLEQEMNGNLIVPAVGECLPVV